MNRNLLSYLSIPLILIIIGLPLLTINPHLGTILVTSSFWLFLHFFLMHRIKRQAVTALHEHQRAEKFHAQHTRKLNERVKELRSLLEASEIMVQDELPLEDTLQQIVTCMPAALQNSEKAWARINLKGQSYTAGRLGDGPSISQPVISNGQHIGSFEFGYQQSSKNTEAEAFLAEEHNLLSILSSQVGHLYEKKTAHEQLQLAALVFDNSREMIAITDGQQHVLSVNKAFTKITGYHAEELIGKHIRTIKSNRHDKAFYTAMWRDISEAGFWQGELWNRSKQGALYPVLASIAAVRGKDGIINHYIAVSTDISKNKKAEEHIRYLAYYDPLTELPNRILLEDRASQILHKARNKQLSVACLFLDIDHFKTINDSLGHLSGDELLQEVASRINKALQHDEIAGRVGGDEFLIILADTEGSGAIQVAHHLLEVMAQPFVINKHTLYISISIGIAVYPNDGENFHELLKNSDIAKHKAKELGRNRYYFFTPELNEAAMERFTLERALRTALESNNLALHYQPQIDLKSGRVIGVEALLRWQHPELGFISPAKFIPIAEQSGLIAQIGTWVLQEACRQNKIWQENGLPPFTVAINISVRQFSLSNIASEVKQALASTGLLAKHLEVEITESLLAQDMEATLAMLQELSTIGVQIAVDDFGTGYSSLAYLKRFPLDKLKLDQSFVHDLEENPDDRAIASGVVNLGQSLGLGVIAEGVETEGQLAILQQLGCDEIQGYLFSRPLPADELADWLRNYPQQHDARTACL
ncbi:MAG: EAL domain-containing protein [Thiohalomonadaceae bacterium]